MTTASKARLLRAASLMICVIFINNVSFSQTNQTTNAPQIENYAIITIGSTYSESQIKSAFNNANFCGKYYFNSRRTLLFDDGSKVELFNANECQGLMASCFISAPTNQTSSDRIWKITPNGYLVEKISIDPTKTKSTSTH